MASLKMIANATAFGAGTRTLHGPGCTCPLCTRALGVGRPQRTRQVVRAAKQAVAYDDAFDKLLEKNNVWASSISAHDPTFFPNLAKGQAPQFLWIGCSDSRVVPNLTTATRPGDVFCHRNVGNIVSHADMNCMSAIEFSVLALGVKHVIVCGHYGCGAVNAAMTLPQKSDGVTNCWIASIREVRNYYAEELSKLEGADKQRFLCEANAIRQAFNACTAPPIQSAWEKGLEVYVHAVIFDLATGKLKRLAGPFSSLEQATKAEATQFKQLSEKISKDLTDVLAFEKAM